MQCIKKLTDDISFNCLTKPIKGLEKRVLLVNFNDIDRKQTIINASKTTIKSLVLKSDARGYLFEGFKNHFKGSQKLNSQNFSQEILLRIYQITDENLQRINEAVKGTFIAITETKFKGENGESAFEVLGFDAGLKLSELQRDYDKNSITLTFSTPSTLKESKMIYKWLEGDYNKTLKRFERRLTDAEFKFFDDTFDDTFE